mgnify:CR=1 FL=1
MPVTGIKPIVIPIFSRKWNIHIAVTPSTIKLPVSVFAFFAMIGTFVNFFTAVKILS